MSCHDPAHVCVGHATWHVQGLIRPSETTTKARLVLTFCILYQPRNAAGRNQAGQVRPLVPAVQTTRFSPTRTSWQQNLLHMLPA